MPFAIVPDQAASLATWAEWYGAQGWPVLPSHTPTATGCSCRDGVQCPRPGKHPRLKWKEASTNAQTIQGWWTKWPDANIQLMTGVACCVLDVDFRHNGHMTLGLLEAQHGRLPETPQVISGSGSTHYYFAVPDGGCLSADGIAEGLDFKGYHQLIVAPPSLHVSGQRYGWDVLFSLDAFALALPPAWLLALVHAKQAPQRGPTDPLTPGTIIPEGQRYGFFIRLAGQHRYSGLGEDAIFDVLMVANRICDPPEDEHVLRTYAAWAVRQATAPPHVLNPAMLMVPAWHPPAPNGTAPVSPGGFDVDAGVSSRELVKMMRVPPRFLVDKLVPDGLTILAAPAKSYKSYFSLSLALATIGEGDWCDTFPVESTGNVVFFGLEAPLMQLRNRLYQLRPSYQPDANPHELVFYSGMHALPTFKNGLQSAVEQVIARYTPRLIVIDPLSYLYRLGRQDDLASATIDLLWPLAEMASAAQVAIFAPEHMRKRSKDDVSVVDQLAGSHVKPALVHGLLSLHREGEDVVIETTMRDARPQELVLTLSFDEDLQRVTWGYKGANITLGQSRIDSMTHQTLGELRSKRYPMRVLDLISNLGFPNTDQTKSGMRQILYKAEKAGDVACSKRGEYYWIGQE